MESQLRDLMADLEICNKATPGPWMIDLPQKSIWSETDPGIVVNRVALWNDVQFIAQAREGWPHAIERAIKAESEVERYKLMVKSITGGLDEAIETVHYLEAENALLRKVADAAKRVCALCLVNDTCIPDDCWVWPIKVALKEGE